MTLNNSIAKYVKNSSTIFTDQCKGYFHLILLGYQHFTINHRIELAIPNTNIHTILLKALVVGWKHLLRKDTEQKSNTILSFVVHVQEKFSFWYSYIKN